MVGQKSGLLQIWNEDSQEIGGTTGSGGQGRHPKSPLGAQELGRTVQELWGSGDGKDSLARPVGEGPWACGSGLPHVIIRSPSGKL